MQTRPKGATSQEGVTLEKLDWSGSPIRAAVTLRKGTEQMELSADANVVSKKNDLSKKSARVEIEAKFIEVPAAVADGLTFPRSESFMDKFPGASLPQPKPQALSLRAVLNEKEAEQLIRTLSKKGVDIFSSPKVTTLSQQRGIIEVVREFRYPSEWNPPDQTNKLWTPKAFEARNTGVVVEVEATLTEGDVIDLAVEPKVVEFLGFVDFETKKPLFAAKVDPAKTALNRTSPLGFEPPNRPTQPIFSTRKSRTDLSLYSGQTLVLIGSGESEETEPFAPPSAGRQLVVLVRASVVNPEETPSSPKQEPNPQPTNP